MATVETQILDDVIVSSRRKLMTAGGMAVAGALMGSATQAKAQAATLTDADYLNFALNLEYLEATFYTLAYMGKTIDQIGIGIGPGTSATGGGTVTVKPTGTASCMVPFLMPAVQSYAQEIAGEEQKHVIFLRGALGASAVAMPNLDLYNSFNALAAAAGISSAFDPFKNDIAFLLGSYIFEDVGVTAYHGAAGALTSTANLIPAVGIHAVEAYHAGLIRTVLWGISQTTINSGIMRDTGAISNLRRTLDGTGNDDIGLTLQPAPLEGATASVMASTIVNADSSSIGFSRTPQQVLNIVYGNAAGAKGGFYPNGMNGNIS